MSLTGNSKLQPSVQSVVAPSHRFRSEVKLLLSSYFSGAPEGKNLGTSGYSYDIVARLFMPLLEEYGSVQEVDCRHTPIELHASKLKVSRPLPIHLCFMPLQDANPVAGCHNVVVPAWEYPDLPDRSIDGHEKNNWITAAGDWDAILVGQESTRKNFSDAGIETPTHVVQVPTSREYHSLPNWSHTTAQRVLSKAAILAGRVASQSGSPQVAIDSRGENRRKRQLLGALKSAYRRYVRGRLSSRLASTLRAGYTAVSEAWRDPSGEFDWADDVALSGVVYTSIFNPSDPRKNWEDLISGFVAAFKDCPDATLVLKLVTQDRTFLNHVLSYYARMDRRHRCRIVVLPDFLANEEMIALAKATTYYVTTTRAEGNCLPLTRIPQIETKSGCSQRRVEPTKQGV